MKHISFDIYNIHYNKRIYNIYTMRFSYAKPIPIIVQDSIKQPKQS